MWTILDTKKLRKWARKAFAILAMFFLLQKIASYWLNFGHNSYFQWWKSTLKSIDFSYSVFFIIIIVIIIIFNGGNPPVTNPHHYHYCQNPTMVGFWLVGICWGTMTMAMMSIIMIRIMMRILWGVLDRQEITQSVGKSLLEMREMH